MSAPEWPHLWPGHLRHEPDPAAARGYQARRGQAASYTTDDLISNYQCRNLNSVVFNKDTAQVSLLSARKELSMAEQRLAEEIDSYFKDHLIYKRNRRMGRRVIGEF